jgi:hypothetical protein
MCLHCHVVSIGVAVKNLKALIAACNRLGWNLTIGHEHFHWFGSWMDDSPVPRRLFATDAGYQACLTLSVNERQHLMTAKLAAPTAHIQLPGHPRRRLRCPVCIYNANFWSCRSPSASPPTESSTDQTRTESSTTIATDYATVTESGDDCPPSRNTCHFSGLIG